MRTMLATTLLGAARESHYAYVPAFETLETTAPRKPREDEIGIEEENEAAVA